MQQTKQNWEEMREDFLKKSDLKGKIGEMMLDNLIRLALARQAKEIEEAVEKIKSVRWSTVYDVKYDNGFCDGYRQAIADTLLAIKQVINK